MKDLTPKVDDTAGPTGRLTADEFNDMRNDAQNSVTESGQTLTVAVGDDNRQLLKAISIGGGRITRTDGQEAQIGEIVIPDNSAAPLTIDLPTTGLFVNAQISFEQEQGQPFSTFSVTFDSQVANQIMGTDQTVTVTTDNLKGGFRWNGTYWVLFKSETIGESF